VNATKTAKVCGFSYLISEEIKQYIRNARLLPVDNNTVLIPLAMHGSSPGQICMKRILSLTPAAKPVDVASQHDTISSDNS
jgi:hypothetical protein